jgi:hypothetical protein
MIFCFWRRPSLPNNLVETRLNKAKELQLVRGGRGVFTIGRKLPPDIIIQFIIECAILEIQESVLYSVERHLRPVVSVARRPYSKLLKFNATALL